MTYECVFRVTGNGSSWEKSYNSLDEFEPVRKLCVSREIYGPGLAAFATIRTNSWENFAKDFFLPNFVNQIQKTHHTALKIFALITDLITLPIRLAGLYFRYTKNSQSPPKESHPLYQYLKKEGVSQEILKGEYVRLEGQIFKQSGQGKILEGEFTEALAFIDIPANNETEKSARGGGSSNPRVNALYKYQFPSNV